MNGKLREIKIVADEIQEIACDGGGGALGHPKIYLPFGNKKWIDCYYCGQRFAKTGYETPAEKYQHERSA